MLSKVLFIDSCIGSNAGKAIAVSAAAVAVLPNGIVRAGARYAARCLRRGLLKSLLAMHIISIRLLVLFVFVIVYSLWA